MFCSNTLTYRRGIKRILKQKPSTTSKSKLVEAQRQIDTKLKAFNKQANTIWAKVDPEELQLLPNIRKGKDHVVDEDFDEDFGKRPDEESDEESNRESDQNS